MRAEPRASPRGCVRSRLFAVAPLLCTLAFGPIGCRGEDERAGAERSAASLLRRSPGTLMIRTELLFGLGRRDASEVGEDQWQAFVREHIAPRFPAGHTIVHARGQWRDARGQLQREPSRLVVIVRDPSTRQRDDTAIEQIRDAYKGLFDQEAVMRTDSVEKVSF